MADNLNVAKKRLVMVFKTQDEKQVSLSVDNPQDTLTEAEIKTAMNVVVAQNIFSFGGADIVGLVEAKIVTTNTNEYDLV